MFADSDYVEFRAQVRDFCEREIAPLALAADEDQVFPKIAIEKIHQQAWVPYAAGTMPAEQALAEGVKPLREFMLKQTRQSDVALFARLAKLPAEVRGEDVPLTVLVPAFVTSELKSAFQIGFMIFTP